MPHEKLATYTRKIRDPMLNRPTKGSRILPSPFRTVEVCIPHYEFFCRDCKQAFLKTLPIARHEKEKIACPPCGSKDIEQRWAAFYAVTSKKSA